MWVLSVAVGHRALPPVTPQGQPGDSPWHCHTQSPVCREHKPLFLRLLNPPRAGHPIPVSAGPGLGCDPGQAALPRTPPRACRTAREGNTGVLHSLCAGVRGGRAGWALLGGR